MPKWWWAGGEEPSLGSHPRGPGANATRSRGALTGPVAVDLKRLGYKRQACWSLPEPWLGGHRAGNELGKPCLVP